MATTSYKERRPVSHQEPGREVTDLDRNYRRIGISAVAAAARYCSGASQPPAPSPSEQQAARPRD